MTATLVKEDSNSTRMSAFEQDELFEENIPCSLRFRNIKSGDSEPCPHVAKYDAFVTCELNHERTQHYCERCFKGASKGYVDCRVCRDMGLKAHECPVTLLAVVPRNYPA